MLFRADVYTWIPQAEVPNPLNDLPGGVERWGPGVCGPHFGGDNFVVPPPAHSDWTATFRAKQTLAFEVARFGDAPSVRVDTGCQPGLTTVLTAPRDGGGRVCHSIRASVRVSSSEVAYDSSNGWYRLRMHGEAQDPVPAAVARETAGRLGGWGATAATPNLEWQVDLRIQDSASIPFLTRARYNISRPLSLDVAANTFPKAKAVGAGNRIIHGLITLRRFPSLVLYLTVDSGAGPSTVPHYFADASSRSLGAIVVGQTDVLREITW